MAKDTTFNVDETADQQVIGEPILIGSDDEMEMVHCPFCRGTFGVDATYLDQVTDVIHCPICCMEVIVLEKGD